MSILSLNPELLEAAVLGGAILGGGGGGWIEEGRKLGRLALEVGEPKLVSINELSDEDIIVTVSMVGAPAAKEQYIKPIHYLRALELLAERSGRKIQGIITCENGGAASINGWFQSAMTGIPLIDAPSNGRAHPTGSMGSMNLTELDGYVSVQAAVGGRGSHYLEVCVSGALDKVAQIVRKASVDAGGVVAVARNPIPAKYVKENAAPGAIQQAIKVGQALINNTGLRKIEAVCDVLGGRIAAVGQIREVKLETTGGFDVGCVLIDSYELTFWNEYMTLENQGKRYATFPDLIMTLDAKTGYPLVSAEVKPGMEVAVLVVEKEKLILGAPMRNRTLLQPIEDIVSKPILDFVFKEEVLGERL